MKLKKALVFSTNASNIASLCWGANTLAQESVAIVLGTESQANEAAAWAGKVLWLGEKAQGTMAESYTGAVAQLLEKEQPELLLMGCGTRDRCIAAKLAVRLNAGVITDVSALELDETGAVLAKRNVFGGTAQASVKVLGAMGIVLTSGGFDETAPAVPGAVEKVDAQTEDMGIQLLDTAAKQEESVDIAVAKRIVAVGRGLGAQENLAAAESLAAKLGAEMGCTRPIAEEQHWMSRSRYIGVSGATVKPELYVALGISGQVQHMVGANSSKIIVAINKDGKAPIFQDCDIGLVADMNKVLPRLTELL